MIRVKCDYDLKGDVEFLMESDNVSVVEFAKMTKLSRTTVEEILETGCASKEAFEKIYSCAYRKKYRLNSVKEELLKEKYQLVLFHGSKDGLSKITNDGSRVTCDFGSGFYLGETYNQALSFISEKDDSSVYSFSYSLDNVKIKKFDCDLEWMLAICYYRGSIERYKANDMIKNIVSNVENADVVIAPIVDNKMFYIMTQFTSGEINADVALHSLSASKLGLQYVLKTDKAINRLTPLGKYYVSNPERDDCKKDAIERGFEIDTKLKFAKRQFKTGLYIEEIFK